VASELAEPEVRDKVEVVVVGTDEELELLRSVIGPRDFAGVEARWFRADRLDRDALLSPREPASDVAVRCFVGIGPGRANLYFANRTAERFLVREVSLPNALDPAGREAVGQVLSLSVQALVADAQAGLTRTETERLLGGGPQDPPPPAETKPAERAPRPVRTTTSSLGAAPFYAVKIYSTEVPVVHGPGLRVSWVTAWARSERSISGTFGYELPRRYNVDDVGLSWETASFRGGFELLEGSSGLPLVFGGRAGLGVDLIRFAPKQGATGQKIALTPARSAAVPVFSAAAVAALPITSRLTFGLDLILDVHPVRFAYSVTRPTGTSEVLEPYRVRPGAALHLAIR
jgi:hypothetical protein